MIETTSDVGALNQINATITTLSELLDEGITSDEIMESYRVNLRSNQNRQQQLLFPLTQETIGSNVNKEDIECGFL